jgi:hypothetical protein
MVPESRGSAESDVPAGIGRAEVAMEFPRIEQVMTRTEDIARSQCITANIEGAA